jgi:hypothetical protein
MALPPSGSEEAGLTGCAIVGGASISFEKPLLQTFLAAMLPDDISDPAR